MIYYFIINFYYIFNITIILYLNFIYQGKYV